MAEDPITTLRRLYGNLIDRRPKIGRATDYYDGVHNLAFASEKFLEAFGGLFRAFADNWCGVVVDAVEERLNVDGFRVTDTAAKADDTAWAIWQRNEMDAQSQMAHQEALISGAAYGVVWVDKDGKAEITVEPAQSTIVDCHPKMRQQRTAGLRCWVDEEGYEHAELFFPSDVYRFRSRGKRSSGVDSRRSQWIVDPDAGNDVDSSGRMANPFGVVPVVELLNRPRLNRSRRAGWAAHSEIAAVIPLQDGVNKLVADMLIASEFAAFPQRWLTGYEAQTDPTTGAVIPPDMKAGAGRLHWLEDPQAQFGQFAAADLSNFVKAVDMTIQHIASISRTPPHYLNASADRLSGESIKAAETGLVAKVRRKQRHFGEAWEEIIRIAGRIEKEDQLAGAEAMETIWADPESRTEAEHVDAVMKKKTLNVPDPQLWEDLGYTPQQIARFKALRAQDALFAPLVPVPPVPGALAPVQPTAPAQPGP